LNSDSEKVNMSMKRKVKQFDWRDKHLLGLRDLSAEQISFILDTAEGFGWVGGGKEKESPS